MTHEDVMQMLAETEIPFAYDHFAEGESPDPPFIYFLFPGSENFAADNVVYMEFSNLSIELYTDEKDPELEMVYVDSEGTLHVSSGLAKIFTPGK